MKTAIIFLIVVLIILVFVVCFSAFKIHTLLESMEEDLAMISFKVKKLEGELHSHRVNSLDDLK